VLATDLVIGGRADSAFCAVRPPVITRRAPAPWVLPLQQRRRRAKHALEQHGVERVAIIDFDVHHGNGTETSSATTSAS